jgi:hypothetical protein
MMGINLDCCHGHPKADCESSPNNSNTPGYSTHRSASSVGVIPPRRATSQYASTAASTLGWGPYLDHRVFWGWGLEGLEGLGWGGAGGRWGCVQRSKKHGKARRPESQ